MTLSTVEGILKIHFYEYFVTLWQRWASTDFFEYEYEYEYQPLEYEYEYEYQPVEYEHECSENRTRNENFEYDYFKICVQCRDSIIMESI